MFINIYIYGIYSICVCLYCKYIHTTYYESNENLLHHGRN